MKEQGGAVTPTARYVRARGIVALQGGNQMTGDDLVTAIETVHVLLAELGFIAWFSWDVVDRRAVQRISIRHPDLPEGDT